MTFRCATAARERGDPLVGTAPPARRWVLVEQPRGWGRDALESLAAPDDVRAELAALLAATGARFQLIRRPRPPRPGEAPDDLSWYLLDTEPPVRRAAGGLSAGWAPLLAMLQAWADPASSLRSPGSPRSPRRAVAEAPADAVAGRSATTGFAAAMLLVCTNGRHDVCCALRGRPVAAELETRFPGRVWECTHVGGDRFAANLVILPDGAAYGGLDPETAIDVAEAHLRGRPDHRYLRGVTGRSPHDQAALIAVARELGVVPWDRLRLATQARTPAAPPRATAPHDGPPPHRGWARDVIVDGRLAATVTGHDHIVPPHQLTCSAAAPSRALIPKVDRVELRPG